MIIMVLLTQYEENITRFLESYRDENGVYKYIKLIQDMITNQHNSITIDFKDLYVFNQDIAKNIQNKPVEYLNSIHVSILRKLLNINIETALKIRDFQINLVGLSVIPIRSIRSYHIGKLISVEGEIIQASEIKPYVTKAAFLCLYCQNVKLMEQSTEIITAPSICMICEHTHFHFLPIQSTYKDRQKIVLRDILNTHAFKRLEVELYNNNVDSYKIREDVLVTGILGIQKKMYNNAITRDFNLLLRANNIEIVST